MNSKVKADNIAAFYRTYISGYSQAKVAEDQFVEYWRAVAQRVTGAQFWGALMMGQSYHLTYDISDPIYNDARTRHDSKSP